MRHQNLYSQAQSNPLDRWRHVLFVVVVTVGLTLAGIGVIAMFCQYAIPPIPHGPEFDARVTVADFFFYAGQPAKTVAYQAGCLAAPFLMMLSFWWARRWARGLSDKMVDRITWTGLVLYLLLMLSCAWPIIYCPNPPFAILPPSWILLPIGFSHPWLAPERVLSLLAAGGAELFFLMAPASRRNANRALMLLLAIWAALIPGRFYPPSEINDEPRYIYHLNSVLDALSQSVNGHHLLIDFPHIYGGYIEMLAPIIRLFPRDIGTLIAALAVPSVLGMLCLLFMARLVVRRPAVLFMCGLTLLSVGHLSSCIDIVYGYLTARLFFPPLGLLAATLYFRRPSAFRYAITTAVAALSTIWNLDTGIVLWLSWTATLVAISLAARDLPGIAHHLLTQTLSLIAVWTGFFLYLRLASGQWPEVDMLFYFQKFVVGSGYFCLPMLFPDMWVFILTIYVTGIALAICAFVRGNAGRMTPVMLMLSLFGIGIFSYFMGRSAPSNLVAVAYPAILLASIFCADGEVLMRHGKLPAYARFFLLPSRIALFWWGFLFVAALSELLAISGRVVRHWNNTEQTPLRANAAFVTQRVQPHEEGVYFLSNQSGIYYYLSDTVRSFKIPGNVELLQARDMDGLIEAIRARRISKLFVEQNFYDITMYRPDIYEKVRDAVSQNYQVSEVGPTGLLILYTPR